MKTARMPRQSDSAFIVLGLMVAFVCALAVLLGGIVIAPSRGQSLGCSAPVPASGVLIARCHKGYVTIFNTVAKVPYLVAYRLTGPHTLGCLPRKGLAFKVDPLAPAADQGRPNDYHGSGFDLGHMAPNQDFAWNREEQRSTFSMLNVAPQRPGLNREEWEHLEETVRAWALERGTVDVYVGSVIAQGDPTIGPDHVDVPQAFWKLVYDPAKGESIAFEMPNKTIPKGDLTPYEVSLAVIDQITGTILPVKGDAVVTPHMWSTDLEGWHKAHELACGIRKS